MPSLPTAGHIYSFSALSTGPHIPVSSQSLACVPGQHSDIRKMREVNFSIPNVNKASVGITTALYDRRALDCTSTLPLINSLNHLAYLTTSSARIRDILTVDEIGRAHV